MLTKALALLLIAKTQAGPYRNFNKTGYTKSINSGTFSNFNYLMVDESQSCFSHYLEVCEHNKGLMM